MRSIVVTLIVALNALILLPAAAQGDGVVLPMDKKLIEYGWDVPFADSVQANIRQMEERPFDGLIFKLRGGGKVLMPSKWDEAQFTQDFEACQAIAWDKFTDNFIIMWAATEQDWFNDEHWAAIVNNARLMAKAARLARCAGLCFDAEPYGTNPWAYAKSPHRETKSFADYEAKVQERGAQFMQAIEAEFPRPEILTFFLTTYVRDAAKVMTPEDRAQTLSQQHYGLLPAFLGGMLDAASPGTRLHDGNETAYYYTSSDQYFEKRHYIEQTGRYAIDPVLWDDYRDHVFVGQALYIDQYFGLRTHRVLGHYLTPEQRPKWFEHNVYWALYTTDKYVWCYSERMNWWKDQNVPPGCEDAIRSARRKLAAGEPLGFDLQSFITDGKRREHEAHALGLKQRQADVAKVATPPAIDGNLDEDAWKSATALEPFAPLATIPDCMEVETHAWAGWDNANLYLAFRCAEPNPDGMNISGEARDDHLFEADVVEVFVLTNPSARCRHFAVNPRGVYWDALHNGSPDTGYNPEWHCAAHIGADFWSVEMAIPWAALDIQSPYPGLSFKGNLCRERRKATELTAWSPTLRVFLEPEHFGTLTLK